MVIVAPISDHDQITVPYGVDYQPVLMNRTSKGVKDGIEYFCQLYRIFREVKPDMVINYTIKPILLGWSHVFYVFHLSLFSRELVLCYLVWPGKVLLNRLLA